jgi:hypothetical protein
MRIWRVILPVAAALLLLGVSAGAAPPKPDAAVAAVEDLEHARQHAMVSVDIDVLDEILSEDLTYIHSTGLAQSKDDLLGMLAKGDIRYVSFRMEAVTYRSYNGAVVGSGVQSIDLTSSGKPFTSRSRYTVVYVPVKGSLRMVSYQATTMPEIVMQEKVSDRKSP